MVLHRVSAFHGVNEIRSELKLSGGGRFSMPRFRSLAVLSLVRRPREGNAVRGIELNIADHLDFRRGVSVDHASMSIDND